MARTVTSAIVQVAWTGDKESMIELHEKYVAEAASAGAQVMCFQELFYGPYFCQVQDTEFYSYAEAVPDGPTTKRFQELAAKHEMVLVLPMYEHEQAGFLYNTAAVIDADGSYLGKYRKTHIPQVKGFWEKFYFRPGNLGYPVFETAVGTVGVIVASGGTAAAAIVGAAVAGGIGLAIGAALAKMIGEHHADALKDHLDKGGLLLWVRTPDGDHETRACDILKKAGAEDVHVHDLPEATFKMKGGISHDTSFMNRLGL